MTSLDALFDQYQTAHTAGDSKECERILDVVSDDDLETFTARLEAAGLDREATPAPEPDRMRDTLTRSGLGMQEATALSILSGGCFADFVRERMRARSTGPDTLLRDATEDGASSLDSEDEELVAAWIAQVLDGADEPDVELPAGADALLARALGSTEQTILAVRERG